MYAIFPSLSPHTSPNNTWWKRIPYTENPKPDVPTPIKASNLDTHPATNLDAPPPATLRLSNKELCSLMDSHHPTWWEDLQSELSDEERAHHSNTKSAWVELSVTYKPISNMTEAEDFRKECETKHHFEFEITLTLLSINPNRRGKPELEKAEILQQTFLERYPHKYRQIVQNRTLPPLLPATIPEKPHSPSTHGQCI
jgi:hypothetical protein